MKNEILIICMEKGILLDREVCEILSNMEEVEAREIIEKISYMKGKIITKSFFNENVEKLRGLINSQNIFDKLKINLNLNIELSKNPKEEIREDKKERKIKVLSSITQQKQKLEVQHFVKYFRARVSELKAILQTRPELENLTSINKLHGDRQNFSVIGIVYSKNITKNKNILIELEDLTGKIKILINQNKPELYEKAKDIILDTVIGVKGTGSKDFLFANEIIFPEAIIHEKSFLEREEYAAFTSDVHTGSKMFLEKNFLRFIDWINGMSGDEKQREEAKKVKYLFITGDTIDGIGVYPGQEELLTIKDIKEQYIKLASLLSKIRKDVTIILCPGQHDAVRVAEPQPALGMEYAGALYDLDNLILVSNPGMVEILNDSKKGVKVLMYHGASFHSFIDEVESLRSIRAYDTPSKIVKHVLRVRHLSPIHSLVTYIPDEKQDDLIIRDVPDIITTADLHRPDVDVYNNILIICSSCWQSITPFEEKVGNHPDPCKVPILNLKTRQLKILDFSDEEVAENNLNKSIELLKK